MKCGICKIRNASKGYKTCKFCRESSRIRQNIKTDKAQKKAIEYKGSKCKDCGDSYDMKDVYDFHHRDENKKLYDLNLIWPRAWHIVQTELDKCDMLCANCHQIRHSFNISKTKNKCIEIKGNLCHRCKETFEPVVYQFHHIRDKRYEINRLLSKYKGGAKGWKTIEQELAKCVMVCANCHRIIHYEERNHKDLYSPRFDLGGEYLREFKNKKVPAYLSYTTNDQGLRQKILIAKKEGKEFREMAEEWGIDYKKIIRMAETLHKEMTLEQRIAFELLTKKEIRSLL